MADAPTSGLVETGPSRLLVCTVSLVDGDDTAVEAGTFGPVAARDKTGIQVRAFTIVLATSLLALKFLILLFS